MSTFKLKQTADEVQVAIDNGLVAVTYGDQELDEAKKVKARSNIGAVDEGYVINAIDTALGKVNLEEYELLGQTPQYLSDAESIYSLVVDVKEQTNVSITSDTVADLSTAENVTFQNATEKYENGIYKMTFSSGGMWFQHRKGFDVAGLIPGEKYTLFYDVTGVQQTNTGKSQFGQISIHDALDPNLANVLSEAIYLEGDVKRFSFTALSSVARVYICGVTSDMTSYEGAEIQYRDIWINQYSAKELRTPIFKREVSTADRLTLKNINGGLTIQANPNADVYLQIVEDQSVPSILSGKTCVCFGDSLTGNYASPFDYPSVIAKKTGMTVVNGGFGGCRMSSHPSSLYDAYSMYRLADSVASGDWSVQDAVADATIQEGSPMYAIEHIDALKALDWNNVDIVTILFGGNDFMGGAPLVNETDPLSVSSYKGAARYSIERLLTAYPMLRIVLVTPFYFFRKVDGEIVDTDTFTAGADGNTKLSEYIDALREVAEEYKLPFFDMYNTLGFNKVNREIFLPDGGHPSTDGTERVGESLAARLMSI